MSVKEILFSFKGRITRLPFLLYGGATYIIIILLFLVPALIITKTKPETLGQLLLCVVPIFLIQGFLWMWVQTAICAKRFQDCNKPGWISFIPTILGMVQNIFIFIIAFSHQEPSPENPYIIGFAVTFLGFLIVFSPIFSYLMIIKGTAGPNRYGSDPLAPFITNT